MVKSQEVGGCCDVVTLLVGVIHVVNSGGGCGYRWSYKTRLQVRWARLYNVVGVVRYEVGVRTF